MPTKITHKLTTYLKNFSIITSEVESLSGKKQASKKKETESRIKSKEKNVYEYIEIRENTCLMHYFFLTKQDFDITFGSI